MNIKQLNEYCMTEGRTILVKNGYLVGIKGRQ